MRLLGGLLTLLTSLLATSIFIVAGWGTLILVHEGHSWVLVLPFFTHLWALALLVWIAFFLVAALASVVDDA